MIETIYHKEDCTEENVKLPKNIYQIGYGEEKCHIYVEDKTLEFLKLVPEREQDIRYGVLLGNVKFSRGESYFFINGVIDVRDILDNVLIFGDDTWTGIYEDLKKYYCGEKIVGWYASLGSFRPRDMFHIRKLHLDHFAGDDKLFLNLEREEDEQTFFVYGNGDMQCVECYHIYYEKNPKLENYICETHYDLKSRKKTTSIRTERVLESTESPAVQRNIEKVEPESINLKHTEEPSEQEHVVESVETIEEIAQTPKKTDMRSGGKRSQWTGKVVSFATVAALVFVTGSMYKKGQFNNLYQEMQEVVAGIMNKEEASGLENIVTIEPTTDLQEQAESITLSETNTETVDAAATTAFTENQPEEQTSQQAEEISSQSEPSAEGSDKENGIYIVKKGDTLYGICKKLYGNIDNIETIMQLNGMQSADNLATGKELIVP